MTHFGIICPAAIGHLNPMTTLGYELKKRGHRVTVLAIADAKPKVEAAGLEFQIVGESDFPTGATRELYTQLGNLSGIKALKYTIQWIVNTANSYFQDAPAIIEQEGIEALIVDQVSSEGGTIAEYLGIPFISIANALICNREPSVPPLNSSASYDDSWQAILRNRIGYFVFNLATKDITNKINSQRQKWNLPLYNHPNQRYSSLAQISQQPQEFEYPRQQLPDCFHFTGSFSNPTTRKQIDFPYERLTDKPLIYASLGTLQNQLLWVFEQIAEACVDLDAQLIISLGGGASAESLPELPGNPIVVGYAPQLELLKRASLTITHAGLNTTLESLSNGVPMVAIPIANDQPGVAGRIAWTSTGEVVPLKKITVEKLRTAIAKVLTDDSYRQNALRLKEAMEQSAGVSKAADIIEQVVITQEPVTA